MKTIKYTTKTKWAGLVWVWGATLNKVPSDGALSITCDGITKVIEQKDLRENIVRQKKMFNKLTGKEDTQYGFLIK